MSEGEVHIQVPGATDEPPVVGSPIFGYDGARMEAVNAEAVQAYNFRNPMLKSGDLRQLEVMTQKFIDHLSARLSTFLRMECLVKLVKFGSTTYSKFTGSIDEVTHLTMFQIHSLSGIGILDMGLPLSLCIADRMLGGKGNPKEPDRGLTEIETALVEDAAQLILTEWTRHWPEQERPFHPKIAGHDNTARFLHTAEDDAIMAIIQAEVTLGESTGRMQIAVPFLMIEPIVKLIEGSRLKSIEPKPKNMEWRSQFNSIHVPVIAEWIVRDMPVSEVIQLQPGDVLEMSRDMIACTQIRLSNAPEFIGTAGVEDGRVAVQLTQRTNSE